MKHTILAVLILTLSNCGAFASRPKIDYQESFLEVTDVERQDTCLRISVILKNSPGYWVNIPKNDVFLRSQNDTVRKYRLIGSEKFELNKRIWMKETGQHEGVLIFEKIPSDVRVVDMMETENNGKLETIVAGLNLDEKDTNELPVMIDPKSLFDTDSSNKWTGLDPTRYTDIPFYKKQGKAYIKGELHDYHPRAGYSTLNVYTENYITGSRERQTENIDPDGKFEFDINVDYPQYCTLEIGDFPSNDVFVIPGDTIELVTTTKADFLNPGKGFRKYFGYRGRINDATAVNLLTDSVRSRYRLDEIISTCLIANTDTLGESVNSKKEKIGNAFNEIISDLPQFLGSIPVSTYVKDLLATEVTRIPALYGPPAEYNRLISCNPLAISTGYKVKYNPISIILKDSTAALENGKCFLQQLQGVNALLEEIEVKTLHNRESLDQTKQNVSEMVSQITYPALNKALLNAYTELVEEVVLEENSVKKKSEYIKLDVDKEKDVLEELIKPYLGNLIYIDFWALWCPPCRQGMINQKNLIGKFADQPFKVLYVSDDSNVEGSNNWLEKKQIPGEHIYLSSENWKRISEYFNFNYVPFGVLIGKDGELIKTHFYLDSPNAEKEIERHLFF
ncbi:MAG: TlpA family protein disulfide reductase [Muribaculaceae bacterium]|nr:TlpA family protein disulfide reductase [Muribaculaceae bacterium]